jgi:hypothetical protein
VENASKALLMAATVLVGVLILSIGVYLFSIFGDFSSETAKQIEEKKISEFNAQFYKYLGQKECRAHDIVTVANLANENNKNNEYTDSDRNTGTYYIKVIVDGKSYEGKTNDTYMQFLKDNPVTNFKCTKVEINNNTKLVKSITFEKN